MTQPMTQPLIEAQGSLLAATLILLQATAAAAQTPDAAPSQPQTPDAVSSDLPTQLPTQLSGAIIIGLQGSAWVSIQGSAPLVIDRCSTIPVGATVCTDERSYVTVRLDSDPDAVGADDVVLLPRTCLEIQPSQAAQPHITVSQGSITVVPTTGATTTGAASTGATTTGATDHDRAGSLSVHTRDGVAVGATGGFRITLEDTATRTEAVDGAVTLTGDRGSVDMPAGTGSRVTAGQAPTAPVDLLLPRSLLTPEDGASLRRPDFSWQPVDGGTGYHVELSATPNFTDIVEAIDLAPAEWHPDFLFVPTNIEGLWWRVSAYDRLGFLGIPTTARPLKLPAGVSG